MFGMILALGLISSCGDDDGPGVDLIVGEWEVDDFELQANNSNFNRVDGEFNSLYGESSYKIEFFQDDTFERELQFSNGDLEDEGEWELDGVDLDLDPEDEVGLIESFEVLEKTTDDLILQGETTFTLLPNDIVRDTVTTQESLDALFDTFGEIQSVTIIFNMERE